MAVKKDHDSMRILLREELEPVTRTVDKIERRLFVGDERPSIQEDLACVKANVATLMRHDQSMPEPRSSSRIPIDTASLKTRASAALIVAGTIAAGVAKFME